MDFSRMGSKTVRYRSLTLSLALAGALALGACTGAETLQRGYVLPEGALERFGGAPAGRKRQRAGQSQRKAEGSFAMTHDFRPQTPQLHFGLASGRALT